MSLETLDRIRRAIYERGSREPILIALSDAIGAAWTLRTRYLPLAAETAGVGVVLDELWRHLDQLTELLCAMQTSCVKLPNPRTTTARVWQVPVYTEWTPYLRALHEPDPHELALERIFRVQFVLQHGVDPVKKCVCWQWKVDQVLETGIPVRER